MMVADLEQEGIAGLLFNGSLHTGGVGHQQVITHHLSKHHQKIFRAMLCYQQSSMEGVSWPGIANSTACREMGLDL